MLIDTHAHLGYKEYEGGLESVIKDSLDNGVGKIICVSSNVGESIRSIEIAKLYKGVVYAAVGIHPQCTDPKNTDAISVQLEKLESLIIQNRDVIVAIGECGLDFADVSEGERKRELDEQEKIFCGQVELALKYGLPILLHFNKSHEYFLDNYKNLRSMRGIFHCYVGGKKRLKRFLEFENFFFGVTGIVTYEEGLQQVTKEIPISRIVLETDSPFLSPLPHRGEINDPSRIPFIAEKIAEIKKIPLGEIEKVTTENASNLFKI